MIVETKDYYKHICDSEYETEKEFIENDDFGVTFLKNNNPKRWKYWDDNKASLDYIKFCPFCGDELDER